MGRRASVDANPLEYPKAFHRIPFLGSQPSVCRARDALPTIRGKSLRRTRLLSCSIVISLLPRLDASNLHSKSRYHESFGLTRTGVIEGPHPDDMEAAMRQRSQGEIGCGFGRRIVVDGREQVCFVDRQARFRAVAINEPGPNIDEATTRGCLKNRFRDVDGSPNMHSGVWRDHADVPVNRRPITSI